MNEIQIERAKAREGFTISSHSVANVVLLPDTVRKHVVGAAFFNTGSAMFLPDPITETPQNRPFSNTAFWRAVRDRHKAFAEALVDTSFEPEKYVDEEHVPVNGLDMLISTMRFLGANPTHHLLIAGHTDRQGDDASNQRLSEARARCVNAVFRGSRKAFVDECTAHHSDEDDMAMLAFAIRNFGWLVQGTTDHGAAVKHFQQQYNRSFPHPITVDGVAGGQTRGAYYDCMDTYLAMKIGGHDLERLRRAIRYVDDGIPCIGCGERFPMENPSQDGLASSKNRRVELLLFTEEQRPNLSGSDPAGVVYGPDYRYEILEAGQTRAAEPTAASNPAKSAEITDAPPQPIGLGESSTDDLVTSMPATVLMKETATDAWDFLGPLQRSLVHTDGTRMAYALNPQGESPRSDARIKAR
jgi:outer membrane protein OmpA-like peptidoglycan-associated protein